MKQCNMLDLVLELHEKSILQVLRLQIGFAIYRTIEETRKAEVPQYVSAEVVVEHVPDELLGEVV